MNGECITCDGYGELFTGTYEPDTGAPITVICRDCYGTGTEAA